MISKQKLQYLCGFNSLIECIRFELRLQCVLESKKLKFSFYKKVGQIEYAVREKTKISKNLDLICKHKNICDDISNNIKSFLPYGLTLKDLALIYDEYKYKSII